VSKISLGHVLNFLTNFKGYLNKIFKEIIIRLFGSGRERM